MAIVTGIREYRGIVELSADGGVFANIKKSSFAIFSLREGDAFDEEEYISRIAASQAKDAYEAALTLLDSAQRTSAGLKKKLLEKGYVEPAADAAVERLKESRLLDDGAFAQRLVELSTDRQVGVYALKRKLCAKGFSEEDADAALESVDDEQQLRQARALAEKLMPRYDGDADKRKSKAKLSQALARRGFSWDVINQAIDGLFDEAW